MMRHRTATRPKTIIRDATAPFTIASPSGTLAQGIGVDQFQFSQRLEMNVADVEVLKEWKFLDTLACLFGFSRYAQVIQGY